MADSLTVHMRMLESDLQQSADNVGRTIRALVATGNSLIILMLVTRLKGNTLVR